MTSEKMLQRRSFLNIELNNVGFDEVLSSIDYFIKEKKVAYIVPVNVDVMVKAEEDTELKKAICNADIVVADGKPLLWIAKRRHQPLKEKISGSDLVPRVCEMAARRGYSIFLMGGKKGIPERAARTLKEQYPDLVISGIYSPDFPFENNQDEIDKMNAMLIETKPDIVLMCLGCPKQEMYIYRNKDIYCSPVSICAGATVDFLAGNVNRAPKWISEIGLEWFYRFLKEPKRLFKRYFIDDMKIFQLYKKYD